jgi:hypothetical protein
MRSQQLLAASRQSVAHCLLQELQKGGEVRCPGLIPQRFSDLMPDAYPAYLYAQERSASFVRYFPLLSDVKRRRELAYFYNLGADEPRMIDLERPKQGLYRATGPDPQLYLNVGQPKVMGLCTTLDVDIELKLAQADAVQLFFKPMGAKAYTEENSRYVPMEGPVERGFVTLSFRLENENGFVDELRLDPMTRKSKSVEIQDIKLYCVRKRPH